MEQVQDESRGSEQPVDGRCGSLLRESDPPRYCLKYPNQGRTRCERHGGTVGTGLDAPNFRSGRWSKKLPSQLAARYDELMEDKEYLSLQHDIGLLDLRLGELLERLEDGESGAGWAKLRTQFATLREGMTGGDAVKIRDAMTEIGRVLNARGGVDSTWLEIREALQERRLLVESERRRLVDMHQMVTVEEVLLLVTAIGGVIQRHVGDPDDRRRIAGEIQALLGPGGTRAAQAMARSERRVRSTARSVTNAR